MNQRAESLQEHYFIFRSQHHFRQYLDNQKSVDEDLKEIKLLLNSILNKEE